MTSIETDSISFDYYSASSHSADIMMIFWLYKQWLLSSIFAVAGANKYTSHRIQQNAIQHMLRLMGDEIYDTSVYTGVQSRTSLQQVILRTKAAYLPGADVKTLRNWFNHFMIFGETPARTEQYCQHIQRTYGDSARIRKKGWVHDELLMEIVEDQPDLYLDEIQIRIFVVTGLLFCTSYIWKNLKRKGYTLRVGSAVASQQDHEERIRYLEAREKAIKTPEMVVFIDEVSKGRNEARRRRRWAKRGTGTPMFKEPWHGSHGKRYTMLGAADVNGFMIDACEVVHQKNNLNDDDPSRGNIDRERFELWVETFLCPTLGNYALQEARSVVVLDNASIHHSEQIVELIQSTGAEILYTAPYSPDLNPIELMFANYKQMLKRHRDLAWVQAHIFSLMNVTPEKARSYFQHCKVPGCEKLSHNQAEEITASLAVTVATQALTNAAAVIVAIQSQL
jgi:hypothetical protein